MSPRSRSNRASATSANGTQRVVRGAPGSLTIRGSYPTRGFFPTTAIGDGPDLG